MDVENEFLDLIQDESIERQIINEANLLAEMRNEDFEKYVATLKIRQDLFKYEIGLLKEAIAMKNKF